MFDRMRARLLAGDVHVAGVLSGTSADGIDVAICRFFGAGGRLVRAELAAFATEPFERDLGARVRAVLDGSRTGLRETALLHRDLGRAFGRTAREVAQRHGYEVELVASHGQTVWHHDGLEVSGPATLQLGDGDEAAEAAGCACVSDFRPRDIAAGGEGAPLSALADGVLFADAPRPLALLNLGGMSNLTLLRGGESERDVVSAFDTGPAGALLDGLARRLLGKPFDEGGQVAARGSVDPQLVEHLMEHPFLELPPPKSTGRDTFGASWVRGLIERASAAGVRDEDLLASAVRFVARAVSLGLERFGGGGTWTVAVAGGGIHHPGLLAALEEEIGAALHSTETWGVPPDAREGMVFATLGARFVVGEASTLTRATGAASGRILGKLSAAPPVRDRTSDGIQRPNRG